MKNQFCRFVLRSIFALLPILLSCSKNSTPPNQESTGAFDFPLSINNRWEYLREERFYNCHRDSVALAPFRDLVVLNVEHKISQQEVFDDSITTYLMSEKLGFISFPENLCTFETDTYYANTKDGLYVYAYRTRPRCNSSGESFGKTPYFLASWDILQIPFKSIGLHGSFSDSDTVIQRIHPRQRIQYPLEIGQEWLYIETPIRILKRVVSIENVKVQAGEFQCYKIQSLFDSDNNGAWDENIESFEYVAEQGIIRQYHLHKNLGISSGVNPPPEPQFYCDRETNLELISFELQTRISIPASTKSGLQNHANPILYRNQP